VGPAPKKAPQTFAFNKSEIARSVVNRPLHVAVYFGQCAGGPEQHGSHLLLIDITRFVELPSESIYRYSDWFRSGLQSNVAGKAPSISNRIVCLKVSRRFEATNGLLGSPRDSMWQGIGRGRSRRTPSQTWPFYKVAGQDGRLSARG